MGRILKLVSHEKGLNIGLRHISVSTSGLVDKINELSQYNFPITLSVSLHNPFDVQRSEIMPVKKKWNVQSRVSACKEYFNTTGRRISFEYALIDGVNDSNKHADELASILRGLAAHVNLIPANPVVENNFKRPDLKKINAFKTRLESHGVNATVRRTLGADINASCGQLRRESTNSQNS